MSAPHPLASVLRRALGLPRPRSADVVVDRDVAVPMPDGVVLRHDRYRPRGVGRGPVVLVRSPYGRRGAFGLVFGRLVAERGLQVVVQAVRGTGGSDGELSPFEEADDGEATVRWLAAQPWCDGRFATLGPSYLGLVQWALAGARPAPEAMGLMVTASQFRDQTYPGEAFSLDNAISWTALVRDQARGGLAGTLDRRRRVARAVATRPLADADVAATGGAVGFYRDWLAESAPGSAYWARRSYTDRVATVAAAGTAVAMTTGWQDIFLPWQLADHAALRAAGARPHLRIGPWTHASPAGIAVGLRESLAAVEERLVPGAGPAVPADTSAAGPVVVDLTGDGGRRVLADWPPPDGRCTTRSWFLHTDHSLGDGPPHAGAGGPDVRWAGTTLDYDPHDPTPAVGGPILAGPAGVRDQTALEERSDVLVCTGPVLATDVVALGHPRAVVHLRVPPHATGHLDVFVRVCDVDPAGRSVNVTDGLRRLTPDDPARDADGTVAVEVDLWPVGHRFAAGHRVRVQVSGGAHPRFARNPGTPASLGAAGPLVAQPREVLHDRAHPSRVELPVEQGASRSSGSGR